MEKVRFHNRRHSPNREMRLTAILPLLELLDAIVEAVGVSAVKDSYVIEAHY